MTPLHRAARLLLASALLVASLAASAQGPSPRIRGPIEAESTVPLAGSLNPHLRSAEDLGALAPDTLIPGVTLVFSRSAAQEADLQQLLAQQSNPSSPLYRHWLTPDQFAARFGLASADLDAAQSWLQSQGFTIESVGRGHDRITFSGTAAQIQQAFGTELHRLRWNNELHFAPASELSLPASLAPVTAAILHLSDFRPRPSVRTIRPHYTAASNQQHFLAPGDITTLYDLTPLTDYNHDGFGQSIAIVGQSFVPTGPNSSITNFQSYTGSYADVVASVIVPNSGMEAILPGDVGESEIDLEYTSALASDANLLFVYTGSNSNYDVFDALTFAITQDIAPLISVSYGACEPLISLTYLQQYNSLFEQAAAQGQTIVASSGDTGATACADYGSQSGLSTSQLQGLAVNFPSSSPYVTAVGGTQMAPGTFTSGASQYWTAASGSDVRNSLLSYVPEVAWNEDSSLGLLASGGGASTVFPRPAWQAGVPGIPSGSYRLLPDIALQASVSSPGYVICSDDPYIVGTATDCVNSLQTTQGSYVVTGGTSFAAPIFTAFLANLSQHQHLSGLGNINPILYALAAQPSVYSSAFHDITSGTTACDSGDPVCSTPGESSFATTTGYDQATGLGSVDVAQLNAQWPPTPFTALTPTATEFSSNGDSQNSTTATPGSSLSGQVDVLAAIGTNGYVAPTGVISIFLDGQLLASAVPLTAVSPSNQSASATYTVSVPQATGSHILLVRYPGDSTHAPSSGALPILVGNIIPSGSFTLSASNLSLSANSTGTSQITITPVNGYSGALSWSSSYTGGSSQTICYLVNSPSISGTTTATMYVGVGTACSTPGALRVPSTVQRSSAQHPRLPFSRSIPSGVAFALLLFAIRRRKLPALLPVALLATLSLSLVGCGGSSGGGGGVSSPQPQVYTLTLTAKDSVNTAITASTSFTLTVN